MPKRYAARPIGDRGEVNLARRIEHLRRDRKWSYETLAKEMSNAGCEITKAALHSIEQGDPPRRITVNELIALADIFTAGNIVELLKPQELIEHERAQELVKRAGDANRSLARLAVDAFELQLELFTLRGENEDLAEYVEGH